jgi:hypothetical protein
LWVVPRPTLRDLTPEEFEDIKQALDEAHGSQNQPRVARRMWKIKWNRRGNELERPARSSQGHLSP